MSDPTPLSHRSEPEADIKWAMDHAEFYRTEEPYLPPSKTHDCIRILSREVERLQAALEAEREARKKADITASYHHTHEIHEGNCQTCYLADAKIAELEAKLNGITITAREGPMARIRELEADLARHRRAMDVKDVAIKDLMGWMDFVEGQNRQFTSSIGLAIKALNINPADLKEAP